MVHVLEHVPSSEWKVCSSYGLCWIKNIMLGGESFTASKLDGPSIDYDIEYSSRVPQNKSTPDPNAGRRPSMTPLAQSQSSQQSSTNPTPTSSTLCGAQQHVVSPTDNAQGRGSPVTQRAAPTITAIIHRRLPMWLLLRDQYYPWIL
ncbi:hypothetical protein FRC03_008001 [Tulasnella sp. 419]|nr:hypothetical protein FRC03_008001 [Tulasnella sp. 419]